MTDLTTDNDTKDTTTDEETSSKLVQSAPEEDTSQEVQQGERSAGGYVSKDG